MTTVDVEAEEAEAPDEGEVEEEEGIPGVGEDMRAELGALSADLTGQLKAITEEMARIKSELYSDNGLAGMAKELQQLQGQLDGGLAAGLGLGGAGGAAAALEEEPA